MYNVLYITNVRRTIPNYPLYVEYTVIFRLNGRIVCVVICMCTNIFVYVGRRIRHVHYSFTAYIIYTSRTLFIHRVHYVYVTYIVNTPRTLFIHRVHYVYATYIIHSPRTLCIRHVHCSYVTYIVHTSRTLFIRHVYSEYTAYSVTSMWFSIVHISYCTLYSVCRTMYTV